VARLAGLSVLHPWVLHGCLFTFLNVTKRECAARYLGRDVCGVGYKKDQVKASRAGRVADAESAAGDTLLTFR
jgi:hypothetical protein